MINFGSNIFILASDSHILSRFVEAEFIVIVFAAIILWTNRKILSVESQLYFPKSEEINSAIVTSVVFAIAGILSFLIIWLTASYTDALVNIGSVEVKMFEEGKGRFLIIIDSASIALLLGMIVFLFRYCGHRTYLTIQHLILLFCFIILLVIPKLPFGARGDILSVIVIPFILIANFGFRIRKKYLLSVIIIAILLISAITLARSRAFKLYNISEFGNLFSNENITSYLEFKGSIFGPVLDSDRISCIALIIEGLDKTSNYMKGESLIAGIGNLLVLLSNKFIGTHFDYPQFMYANQLICFWRFGSYDIKGWAVPPSMAGEFYMQYGYISLILLSILFGKLVMWLRNKINRSSSFFGKFFMLISLIVIIQYITGEISVLAGFFMFKLPLIIGVYYIIKYFVVQPSHKKRWITNS